MASKHTDRSFWFVVDNHPESREITMMSHRMILSVFAPWLPEQHAIALHIGHTTCLTEIK